MTKDHRWKIIRRPAEIQYPGVYQEKMVVMCADDEKEEAERLRDMVLARGGELAELPTKLVGIVEREGLFAFAFWADKVDPRVSEEDLLAGNIRIKIK